MLSKAFTGAVIGIDGLLMEVEVDITHGLPSFTTVGLPEATVRESRERVKSAILNSGYSFPTDRITVNLAPAHIKKEGTGFDLPIALGILSATGVFDETTISGFVILGELALDGRVKPVTGSLPMAIAAKAAGFSGIIVPYDNRREASVATGLSVYPVRTLAEAVEFLLGQLEIASENDEILHDFQDETASEADFSEVRGQQHAKRALEIAAAGSHNLMMIGPPGAGKTMLARRFGGIIPPLTFDEAIETTKIFSVAGLLGREQALVSQRPFRAPHHTISDAGLIGGGQIPRPGEVSLAHNGILFLDELPEFKKSVLEVLRQPLENGEVTISRAASTITYPSEFILIAALNPCPCGYFSDPKHACRCSETQIRQYRNRVSGPLLDRIDLHVDVQAVEYRDLEKEELSESSQDIRERVCAARKRQAIRFDKSGIRVNSQMKNRHINRYCKVDRESSRILETAVEKLGLSARAYHRVLKIARTISDLALSEQIQPVHVMEAVQYRSLDRNRLN